MNSRDGGDDGIRVRVELEDGMHLIVFLRL